MNSTSSDKELLQVYRSAVDCEDCPIDIIAFLDTNDDYLYIILHEWFISRLKSYLYWRSKGEDYVDESIITIGKLAPNVFASAVRQTFEAPCFQLDMSKFKPEEIEQIRIERELTQAEQDWLKMTLPEIFEDIQAEVASRIAHENSAIWKEEFPDYNGESSPPNEGFFDIPSSDDTQTY